MRYYADGEGGGTETPVTSTNTTPVVKPETGAEEKHETAIPYERFQEVLKERDALKAARDAAAEESRKAMEAEAKKQGKWQELAEAKDKELTAVRDALKTSALKQATLVAAVAGNAVDPNDVWALLDKSKLTIDESGTVTGVTEAVAALLAAKPHLVKATGTGYQMPAGGSTGNLTPEQIGNLSMSAYREYKKTHPEA